MGWRRWGWRRAEVGVCGSEADEGRAVGLVGGGVFVGRCIVEVSVARGHGEVVGGVEGRRRGDVVADCGEACAAEGIHESGVIVGGP